MSGTVTAEFEKTSATPNTVQVTVTTAIEGTAWNFTVSCPGQLPPVVFNPACDVPASLEPFTAALTASLEQDIGITVRDSWKVSACWFKELVKFRQGSTVEQEEMFLLASTMVAWGVDLYFVQDIDPPGYVTSGMYLSSQNILVLDDDALRIGIDHSSGSGLLNTMRHEVVHAAQDYMAGIGNGTYLVTGCTTNAHGAANVATDYADASEATKALELESNSAEIDGDIALEAIALATGS
jgi:hypothetical protein